MFVIWVVVKSSIIRRQGILQIIINSENLLSQPPTNNGTLLAIYPRIIWLPDILPKPNKWSHLHFIGKSLQRIKRTPISRQGVNNTAVSNRCYSIILSRYWYYSKVCIQKQSSSLRQNSNIFFDTVQWKMSQKVCARTETYLSIASEYGPYCDVRYSKSRKNIQ